MYVTCFCINFAKNISKMSYLEVIEHESKMIAEAGKAAGRPLEADEVLEILSKPENIEAVESSIRTVTEVRPMILDCDVVRFQNNREKWVAFVGLLDGYPYEIFTGVLDDEDGIALPKTVQKGQIVKTLDEFGQRRYDFQFENRRGYKTVIEGLSERFNKEYWNYAKLISGVLRYRMPLENVVKLVGSLQLDNENINSWASGVARALKKYEA